MFGVRTPFPHLFFTNTSLPASNNFWTKIQLSKKSDAFLSANILLTLIIFFNLLYSISKIDIVAFRTKNWMDENLVVGSRQTSLSRRDVENIVWSFSMPLWCNKQLPGQTASITFEFFGMFVSSRTPSVFFGGRESCACFRNNIPFFRSSSYFLWSNDFYNQQHFVVNILWLIVCHWWAGIFVNKFHHFG